MTPAAAGRPAGGGPRVVLIGPPGAGKSTVGRALAGHLRVPLRDTDADVEARAGKPIREIFVDDGEPHFRALERAAVAAALAEHDGVLALGGGAVMDPRTEADLADYAGRGGAVVFLDVSLAHASPRVGFNQARPLLVGNPRAQWQALMERRRPVYERVSTMAVTTDGRSAGQVARTIAEGLATSAGTPTGPRTPTSTPTPTGTPTGRSAGTPGDRSDDAAGDDQP